MDLEALRIFLDVAREGSLLGAAKAGSASRTTVRRKLDELEASVGVLLMIRGSAGIELTEAGEVLARRSLQLLEQFDILVQTTREIALNPPRPLKFVMPTGMHPEGVSFAVAMLRQVWPDVQIRAHFDHEAGLHGVGDYDICGTLLREIPDGPYDVLKIASLECGLFASPEYLARHDPIREPGDLLVHPLLVWEPPDGEVPVKLPCLHRADLEVAPAAVLNEIHILHEMVNKGDGIGYMPHTNFLPGDEDRFIPVLPDDIRCGVDFRWLISHAVAESPRIKHLVEIIRQFINSAGDV